MKVKSRVLVALVVVLSTLVATAGVAGAPWRRGLSSIDVFGNDDKVCADVITLSSEWHAQLFIFSANFNTNATVGTPLPDLRIPPADLGTVNPPDVINLYASAQDAIDSQGNIRVPTPVVSVEIPLFLSERAVLTDPGSRHVFKGTGTVATPAGYENGDVLYAPFNEAGPSSVALTVGGPSTSGASYNCAPTTTTLSFSASLYRDRVLIPARYPSLVWFDPAGVDTATVTVAADNGAPTSARYLGTFFGKAYFSLRLADAGVNCSSTSIKLTASGTSGQSFEGTRPVRPIGC